MAETMSRLNIEDEDGREGADGQPNPYPDRPGEPNCSFYLRTGLCSYGSKCKYNHPNITAKVRAIGLLLIVFCSSSSSFLPSIVILEMDYLVFVLTHSSAPGNSV